VPEANMGHQCPTRDRATQTASTTHLPTKVLEGLGSSAWGSRRGCGWKHVPLVVIVEPFSTHSFCSWPCIPLVYILFLPEKNLNYNDQK
jgi:hypothetical protein